ncbi:MAG TPA: SMP-30/gluconolactonase/LRE family protein [Polyangia bacterium]
MAKHLGFSRRRFLGSMGAAVWAGAGLANARGARAEPTVAANAVTSHTAPYPVVGSIERLDPALDALIPPDAKIEKLADGFDWAEGPVWVKPRGFLLFSDVPRNVVYRWHPKQGVSVYLEPSGYSGTRTDLREPGSNGLALGKRGELVLCQHGDRRLAKRTSWAPNAKLVALADRFEGKRFNSPNDVVLHPSGDLFFTDPPYGLGKQMDDPEKELPFQGVFRLDGKGQVHLVHKDLERPNGVALSPDGRVLYVANSFGKRPVIMAFELDAQRAVIGARTFFDGTTLAADKTRKGGFDGLVVDHAGNVFTTGPGGVLILTPAGKHLGTILTGVATANCEFGGPDGRSLFVTADSYLGRVVTSTRGL